MKASPHLDTFCGSPPVENALRTVHNATTVERFWPAVKRLLGVAIPHHSLSLYFDYFALDGGFRVLHEQGQPGAVVPWSLRRQLSPAPDFLRKHPGIKTYRLRQLVPDSGSLRRSDYFRQVMRVEGWDALLGLGFWEGERLAALLVLRRTAEQGEFGPEDAALLDRLHPHFHDTLRRIRRHDSEQALQLCLSGLLESLPFGVMVFDWDLALRCKNEIAVRFCLAWQYGEDRAGQLHPGRAFAVPAEIAAAVARARDFALGASGAAGDSGVIALGAGSLRVQVLAPAKTSLARPLLLVELRPGQTEPPVPSLPLGRLTPAERAVAQLAAEGLSNGEIGRRLGKSERTVAAQMGSILAKLDLPSRVSLARLMSSPAGTLPLAQR